MTAFFPRRTSSPLSITLALVLLATVVLSTSVHAAQADSGTLVVPGTRDAAARAGASTGTPAAAQPAARRSDAERSEPSSSVRTAPAQDADPAQRQSAQKPVVRSEFQRFVETATGRQLAVFGSNFFAEAADSFAPMDNVPVSADYVVSTGDEIVIRAWGSIELDYRATVDRNGLLNLPRVGSFSVAGIKASALENHLRAQIGRLFKNFSLNVTLGQLRGIKVFVVGPTVKPGVYNLPSQASLLSAVVAAGGPSSAGSMRKISLRRDGRIVTVLDVYDFLVNGDKSRDLQLVAGDVVVFHPVGPRVALTGATDSAAIFELKSAQETVRDVLGYSGGASVLANRQRVHLERIDPRQQRAKRFVEEFKLDEEGLQKPLRDGDVLALLAISPEFANAVTLKGHVAQPLRFPWRAGMRILDLIPDKDALITPDFYRRKNLLVQLIEVEQGHASASAKVAPAALFDELNWSYAVIERLNVRDLATQVIPFNLGAAVLQRDAAQNIELLAGDVVTVYSQKEIRVPLARQTRLVSVEGEVAAPGVYQLQPGETLKELIARTGGFTPQAYIYGLELNREQTRQQQRENLTAALARLESLAATQAARASANRRDDSSAANDLAVSNAATQAQISRLTRIQPNGRIALELAPSVEKLDELPEVPLEHGDRLVIPSRPGFVTVAGAVVNNNAFLWKPGRTAGDYIKLAGLDEGAEISNMFILRADGTVNHANDQRGIFGFGGGLQSQPLYPGDAVVVPNQLDFETWGRALVRNLKDWSQIFSQFGLGAAAIQTLRR
jgi:protein involved in polysaccharide export with SLBB domain